jgi:hypothetical protein
MAEKFIQGFNSAFSAEEDEKPTVDASSEDKARQELEKYFETMDLKEKTEQTKNCAKECEKKSESSKKNVTIPSSMMWDLELEMAASVPQKKVSISSKKPQITDSFDLEFGLFSSPQPSPQISGSQKNSPVKSLTPAKVSPNEKSPSLTQPKHLGYKNDDPSLHSVPAIASNLSLSDGTKPFVTGIKTLPVLQLKSSIAKKSDFIGDSGKTFKSPNEISLMNLQVSLTKKDNNVDISSLPTNLAFY